MGASFEFLHLDKASEYFCSDHGAFTKVTANRHNHPGGAYGFRLERLGKVLAICTDIEPGDEIDSNVVKLSQGADFRIVFWHVKRWKLLCEISAAPAKPLQRAANLSIGVPGLSGGLIGAEHEPQRGNGNLFSVASLFAALYFTFKMEHRS